MTNVLIVLAHPDENSLTHRFAAELNDVLTARGAVTGVADLAAEGFEPRFGIDDHDAFLGRRAVPGDVVLEQKRIDEAEHLFLVFPVYWWSMPALLKGWIDRVFVRGWAFEQPEGGPLRPKLKDLTVHLIPVAGADAGVYRRHGYGASLSTQIDHGIVDYCGAKRGSTTYLYDTDTKPRTDLNEEMRQLAHEITAPLLTPKM